MQRRKASGDEAWLLSYADLITNLLIFFVMLLSAAEISRSKMQKITQNLSGQESPQSLSSIQKEIDQKIVERGMESLVSTKLTDDGLELSLNSGIVFDSGKALIRDEVTKIVSAMLGTLSPYAQRYAFAVEGHTDRIPLSEGSNYRSNWELSTARAHAVRSRLEATGIPPERIRVEGYADTKPLPPDELKGLSDTEVLARHRRVIVRVY